MTIFHFLPLVAEMNFRLSDKDKVRIQTLSYICEYSQFAIFHFHFNVHTIDAARIDVTDEAESKRSNGMTLATTRATCLRNEIIIYNVEKGIKAESDDNKHQFQCVLEEKKVFKLTELKLKLKLKRNQRHLQSYESNYS